MVFLVSPIMIMKLSFIQDGRKRSTSEFLQLYTFILFFPLDKNVSLSRCKVVLLLIKGNY